MKAPPTMRAEKTSPGDGCGTQRTSNVSGLGRAWSFSMDDDITNGRRVVVIGQEMYAGLLDAERSGPTETTADGSTPAVRS
ncbi:MAG: hypothetical protein IPK13_25210 [Deltaproteobacteria bacterium]|nr:hypothetical protein [Deltaproteobacteria bacterium]